MSFLRPISRSAVRSTLRSTPRISPFQTRFATSDYGSGKGNPAGETPEKQGQNPSENLEHPGPPPPKVAEGKSSSSPNSDNGGSNANPKADSKTANAKTGSAGAGGKREFSTFARRMGKEPAVEQGKDLKPSKEEIKGAKPKLAASKVEPGDESEEVKKHNEAVENRAEKPAGSSK